VAFNQKELTKIIARTNLNNGANTADALKQINLRRRVIRRDASDNGRKPIGCAPK
jgi:hypothetical protein